MPPIIGFEAHVTIEPVFGDRLDKFEMLAGIVGFKVAKLLMQKSRAETPDRSNKDSFCTGHSADYESLECKVLSLVEVLQECGFSVWRYKIEAIVLDVKLDRKNGQTT